ncbi:thiaminase II [Paraliobacillus ryukyuensis]|uniref:thiaminase II n=1 Tax=Paraliobacillus ryukyuensis TaxID=200904 RepID=UPI0009A590F0|nr:thiaminase II [Paraliobacillus ryukyuensis]
MLFSDQIQQEIEPVWQASIQHPFVKEIGEGTLPLENFRFYIMQDAYYLTHFAKVQSLGAAKASDLATTKKMNVHAQGTYEAELSLHETFSKLLNITEQDQRVFQPAPTAYAYTSHLYQAAYQGHLGDIIAAILPCYWIYHDVGEALKDKQPEEPIYQEWLNAYGSEWFKNLVKEQINHLNEIAETVTPDERERMKNHFIISVQYEYMFWEMAYHLEQWPVDII